MPTSIRLRSVTRCGAALTLFALSVLPLQPAHGQSLSSGGLTATIVDSRGAPLREVTVSLERGGAAIRTVTTERDGTIHFSILAAGVYSVLAEEFGFQPVRMHDIPVGNGSTSRVIITLVRKPPPIISVTDVPSNAVMSTASRGMSVMGRDLDLFAWHHDISGVPEMFSQVDAPRDGRSGFVATANGLRPSFSTLTVDGLDEALLRHPGIPSEPASAPLFARDGVEQVSALSSPGSLGIPPNLGGLLDADTRSGGQKFSFRPWATVSSAKLGGRSLDNPADSNATSIQAGVAMGGSIKADTASWAIRADYQQLQTPTATPFEAGIVHSDSSADLGSAITAAATTVGKQNVSALVAPTVRSWKGGSGSGRLDWRFGASTLFAVRAGVASWTEDNAQIGNELVSGAGNHLDAKDVSGGLALTTGGEVWTSETRVGAHSSQRDWTGSATPTTSIVGDDFAFGSPFTLAGNFKETAFELNEGVTVRFGEQSLRVGGSLVHRSLNYNWVPGSAGEYLFGDLPGFNANRGAFYQAMASAAAPDLGITDLGFFLEDTWRATPALNLFGGIRFDKEELPSDAVTGSLGWERVSGFRNDVVPSDSVKSHDLAPRAGFSWDVSGNGRTSVRGQTGLVSGQFDVAALAEAAQYDGTITVRRATGVLVWPAVGGLAGTAVGEALTTFGPGVRKPRGYNSELSLVQLLGDATTFTATGTYRHADYLLQRTDLNRVPGLLATGSDGRPIYGSLQQFGALLTPSVGSNRRFPEFDFVYGLSSTGYNDYYETTFQLDHHLSDRLSAQLSYTWSRTTDNLPGELSADPADRLSPFPTGLNGVRWEDGKSDLDIPSRAIATISYRGAGKAGLVLAARYRYRSGLPFTPGFRPGVDANGDGSGNNDPAGVTTGLAGMPAVISANSCLAGQSDKFAARNSCRDPAVQSLDLRAGFQIAHGVSLTIDGFNIVGTETGLYDHALVLVDPKGSITTDASGHTVLPLIANSGFGALLSRRGEPRVLRVGFQVEN